MFVVVTMVLPDQNENDDQALSVLQMYSTTVYGKIAWTSA